MPNSQDLGAPVSSDRSQGAGRGTWTLRPARPQSRFWPVLIVLCLGAAIGAFIGASLDRGQVEQTTSASILLTPFDNNVLSSPTSNDPDAQVVEQAVSAQMVYLSSSAFVDEIQARMGVPQRPSFKAIQQGRSPMVVLTGGGATTADADHVLKTALDVYAEKQQRSAEALTDFALRTIDDRRREVADRPGDQAALLSRIDLLRLDLQLQAARGPGYEVVQPPTPNAPAGTPIWVLSAVLGAASGGLLAVGLLVISRATSRRVSEADVHETVDRVLEPVVNQSQQIAPGRIPGDGARETGRVLFGQLNDRDALGRQVVVVLGVSPRSGSAEIAAAVHLAASERSDAVLLQDTGELNSEWTGNDPSDLSTIVIDAGSVRDERAIESLDLASAVVFVVREGVDYRDAMRMTAAVVAEHVPKVTAVVTTCSSPRKLSMRLSLGLRKTRRVETAAMDKSQSASSRIPGWGCRYVAFAYRARHGLLCSKGHGQ
jgi:hypothetical protein